MDTLWQDLRFALRGLAQRPGFTLIAVFLLGLGIGANSAIFSVVDAVQLRPLPVPQPNEIVRISTSFRRSAQEIPQGNCSWPDYADIQAQAKSFAGLAWYARRGALLDTGEEIQLILTNEVSGNYFSTLGVQPAAGRFFTEQEIDSPSTPPVVVLGYGFWQRRFGGDAQIIGKTIALNSRSVTVLGIAPRDFSGLDLFITPDAWLPGVQHQGERALLADRNYRHFEVFGRLRPDAPIERAQAELTALATRLSDAYPASNAGRKLSVAYERDRRPGGNLGRLLLAVSGLVLLIACANIANLLFARGEARRREFAVRLALGAGRLRLVRQLLTESLLLSLLGAVCACLFAQWAIHLLPSLVPQMAVRISFDFRLDARVFAFTLGVSLMAVLLFGLVPALQGTRADLVNELKTDALGAAGRAGRISIRRALVVGQIALSMALLCGAGLVVRSLWNVRNADPGFNSQQRMLLVNYAMNMAGYEQARLRSLQREVVERLRALPGVEAVSLMRRFPLASTGGGAKQNLLIAGQEIPPGESGIPVSYNLVDTEYFRVLGTRLLRGRFFSQQDSASSPQVAIINESLAHRYWPGTEPIGRHFRFADRAGDCEIIGVVQDGKYNEIREVPQPYLFLPLEQRLSSEITIAIVTASDPRLLAAPVRAALRELDRNAPVLDIFTLDAHMRSALYADRLVAHLSSALGLVGLFLAAVGLYGIISFLVNRRTRELGVRIALGAQPGNIFQLVLGEGIRLAALGLILGVVFAFWVLPLLGSLLYGVSPADPWTYAGVVATLIFVTLLACFFPARRASRIDPLIALRNE